MNIENDALKNVCIRNCRCYYFDGMINIEDFHFDSILLDEKSYENILIDDVSCNTLIGAKPLHIMFYKLGRFIRDNN